MPNAVQCDRMAQNDIYLCNIAVIDNKSLYSSLLLFSIIFILNWGKGITKSHCSFHMVG